MGTKSVSKLCNIEVLEETARMMVLMLMVCNTLKVL